MNGSLTNLAVLKPTTSVLASVTSTIANNVAGLIGNTDLLEFLVYQKLLDAIFYLNVRIKTRGGRLRIGQRYNLFEMLWILGSSNLE